jgi:cAMP-dependent protein kinase regulator
VSDRKLRELEKQLKKEPGNLALRLQLAALYQDAGKTDQALEQYRAVALAYRDDGRVQQAVAVARQALAVAPDDAELRALVAANQGARQTSPNARVLEAAVKVRELEPMRQARGTAPMDATPSRTPSGLYTPTPLPIPIAYHEADPSRVHSLSGPGLGDETDPGTSGGESSIVDTLPEGPTPALSLPNGSGLSKAARRISQQLVGHGVPIAIENDDLSTELETRRRPRVDAAMLDQLGIPPTGQLPKLELEPVDDEPTNPPAPEPGFGPARIHRAVARLDDDAWIEEPTDPRDQLGDRPGSGVFDQALEATVAQLAPDGTPLIAGFAGLPEEVRHRLLVAAEVRTVPAGQVIMREGDGGESLCVIESGEVRVMKRYGARPAIEVARLGEGAVIGEIAVMTDHRRHATVEAIGEVRLLEMDRAAVASAAAEHGELAELLETVMRERLLSNLMAVAPFFLPLPPERRPEVLARFASRKVSGGTAVVEQGGARGHLHLVLLGALDLSVRRRSGVLVRVGTVGEGGHVGELSLMSDDPEPATATAIGPTEILALDADEFYRIVADEPELWTALRADAQRRLNEIRVAKRGGA